MLRTVWDAWGDLTSLGVWVILVVMIVTDWRGSRTFAFSLLVSFALVLLVVLGIALVS